MGVEMLIWPMLPRSKHHWCLTCAAKGQSSLLKQLNPTHLKVLAEQKEDFCISMACHISCTRLFHHIVTYINMCYLKFRTQSALVQVLLHHMTKILKISSGYVLPIQYTYNIFPLYFCCTMDSIFTASQSKCRFYSKGVKISFWFIELILIFQLA